uniref:Uncharacterized protein MANES_15G113700 n=1 Tax=Rhizophora mucronata TaxID=61149 RepID=A0A2P2JGE1_RHIMU
MRRMLVVVSARGRGGNNRKPLQRGRDLSIEAIQAVQALKRTWSSVPNSPNLDHVLRSKFSRLLKFDMIAVLRELLRQNRCLLALKVTEFFLFLPLYLLLPGRVRVSIPFLFYFFFFCTVVLLTIRMGVLFSICSCCPSFNSSACSIRKLVS